MEYVGHVFGGRRRDNIRLVFVQASFQVSRISHLRQLTATLLFQQLPHFLSLISTYPSVGFNVSWQQVKRAAMLDNGR